MTLLFLLLFLSASSLPYVCAPCVSLQFKYTTIMCLSNKELNKDLLERFEYILKTKDTDEDEPSNGVLHCQLFGGRESVRQALTAECKLKSCIFYRFHLTPFFFIFHHNSITNRQNFHCFHSEKSPKITYRIDRQHIDTADGP